jgi:hypothetical protein
MTTASVVPFPRASEETAFKTLRELREERGWSHGVAIKAMMACATPGEKKSLPGFASLKKNWIRWEKGIVPDGNRSEPFFQPIIARTFGLTPDRIWPVQHAERVIQHAERTRTSVPWSVLPGEYRDQLASRRQAVHEVISQLQTELAYLDAILAIPLPAEG